MRVNLVHRHFHRHHLQMRHMCACGVTKTRNLIRVTWYVTASASVEHGLLMTRWVGMTDWLKGMPFTVLFYTRLPFRVHTPPS